MTFLVKTSSAADEDLRHAFLWYLEKDENLALRLESEVIGCMNHISSNPLKYQIRYNAIRIKFLNSFPYGLHFKIKESEILIVLLFIPANLPEDRTPRR